MKRLIVFVLVMALCVATLSSCKLIDKVKGMFDKTLEEVSDIYDMSQPTKVIATTKQVLGPIELNCSYELITGYVDDSRASVYTVTTEELRSVEEGGNNEEIKDLIKTTTRKTEAIEGIGSRVNGGDWDPEGDIWEIGRGRMALNLDKDAVENVSYDNHTLKFTIPNANVGIVLGEAYAADIASDVEVTIVDDGAVVISIDLHYFLKGDGKNLAESEMTVKVLYTYDLERITIE